MRSLLVAEPDASYTVVEPKRGLFVAFDGIDGSGKGTLVDMLKFAVMEYTGEQVVLAKEPGGTRLGDKIRDILFVDPTTHRMCEDAIELCFFASFVQGLDEVVYPALRAGKVVISDRWIPSQQAYQQARRASEDVQKLYVEFGRKNDVADVLFLLTGDPVIFQQRAAARWTETHQAAKKWNDPDALGKVQEFYVAKFGSDPRTVRVDTTFTDARIVHERVVWPKVKQLIDERRGK